MSGVIFCSCGLARVSQIAHRFFFFLKITLDEQNVVNSSNGTFFTPQVLAHYPEKVSWNSFDSSAVTTVCKEMSRCFLDF